MRDAGPIREAVLQALRTHGEMALCDIVKKSQVSKKPCGWTVKNLVRGGVLQIVAHEKRPHARRWVAIYGITTTVAEPEGVDV